MSYFDHVLMFADEAAALAALTPLGHACDGQWAGHTIPALSITVPVPGWFIAVALEGIDEALIALPDGACRLIADRDAFAAQDGSSYFPYLAADLSPVLLAVGHVEPVFAGTAYPFGV